MDTVDKIASSEVDKDNKPIESVVINSVEISEYKPAQ